MVRSRVPFFDDYSWSVWIESLSGELTPEMIAIADRFEDRFRTRIAWGPAQAKLTALARVFSIYDLQGLSAEQPVKGVYFLATGRLSEQLEFLTAFPEVRTFAISNEFPPWSRQDSATLKALSDFEVHHLTLNGAPRASHLNGIRNDLQSLSLEINGAGYWGEILDAPWPNLRTLKFVGSDKGTARVLGERLDTFATILPQVDELDLFQTSAAPPLLEALSTSPWVATLRGLRIDNGSFKTDRIASIADVPFERLEYLGINAKATAKTAQALAASPHLKTVRSLEIIGQVKRKGIAAILDAWPNLAHIALWDTPHYTDVEAVIDAYDLSAFVRAGGVVEARIC